LYNCRDAQQCIYAKYIEKEEKQNLEIHSIFFATDFKIKKILDIDAEKIGKYKRDKQ